MYKILALFVTLCSQSALSLNGKQYLIKSNQLLSTHRKFGDIELGGLSGLYYSREESTSKKNIFYTITDRGPNAKKKDFTGDGRKDRPFILPKFAPMIVKLEFDRQSKTIKILKTTQIKKPDGTPITGLPNTDRNRFSTNFDETPVTTTGRKLKFDPWGIDPEAIAMDSEGYFWISEEYGPSILQVKKDGTVVKRWIPKVDYKASFKIRAGIKGLPKAFGKRKLNAGFEALTITGNKLIAILQKPLAKSKSKLVPILVFDLKNKKTISTLLYKMDIQSKKIGGATNLQNGNIAVLEHNGKKGEKSSQRIYEVTLDGASPVGEKIYKMSDDLPSDFKPVTKKLLFDIAKLGLILSEKPEGIAYLGGGQIALVNDNDFNLADSLTAKPGKAEIENNIFTLLSID